MDEPARKRRRTTPPEDNGRPSSPLKQPPRRPSLASQARPGAERQSSPLKEPPRRPSMSPTKGTFDSPLRQRPRRPSFASPTKASLARNYPDLYRGPRAERPLSSAFGTSNANDRAEMLARGQEARAFVMGEKDGNTKPMLATATNEGEHQTSRHVPQPRVSKPHDVTPRARRTMAPSRPSGPGDLAEDEGDLPVTPSQMTAEERDTPRRGALYSSPSKRPPQLRDSLKSSSLISRAPAVQQGPSDMALDAFVGIDVMPKNAEKQGKQPPNPELEKRKLERFRLSRELEILESEISRCSEQIVQIQEQSETQVLQPVEREGLITLINKIATTDGDVEEEQAPAVSSLLYSFLPFSTHLLQPGSVQGQQNPVASHQPVALDDALPYLEMFTDFKISTQVNLFQAKSSTDSNRVHQKHTIDLVGPQNLLAVSVSIIIDTLANAIIDLTLVRLPSWADRELGAFMRAKAPEKDLGNACWAVGSYWDIARKRAEFWNRCETSFAHLIPGRTSIDTENRAQAVAGKAFARKDLHRHLGRDALTLEDKHVMLRIKWAITFDWTGEAASDVRVEPALPQVWSEADSSNSFEKIPETFAFLLRNKGVFAATRTMVALLFADS